MSSDRFFSVNQPALPAFGVIKDRRKVQMTLLSDKGKKVRFQWQIQGGHVKKRRLIASPEMKIDGVRWRLVMGRDDEGMIKIRLDLCSDEFDPPSEAGNLFYRVVHPFDPILSRPWLNSKAALNSSGSIKRSGYFGLLNHSRVDEFTDEHGYITIEAYIYKERGDRHATVTSKSAESATILADMTRMEFTQAQRELKKMKKQISKLREERNEALQQHSTSQFALARSDFELTEMTADRDATLKELIASEAALKRSKRMRDTNDDGEEQPANKKQKTGKATIDRTPMLIKLNRQEQEYLRVSNHFHASRGGMPAYARLTFRITQIHRVENARLTSQFHQSMIDMYERGYHSTKEPIRTVYHGTRPENIDSIVRENLAMDKKGQTDSGCFGAGMYFSRYADYCMQYHTTGQWKRVEAGDRGRLLQFDILPGRQYEVDHARMVIARRDGFDSHVSPNEFEYVLFDARHILPRYVIDFEVGEAPGAAFTGTPEETG